eukprot:scaffold674551_cov92-Prasinocladus_malaysianus.AAC.1
MSLAGQLTFDIESDIQPCHLNAICYRCKVRCMHGKLWQTLVRVIEVMGGQLNGVESCVSTSSCGP